MAEHLESTIWRPRGVEPETYAETILQVCRHYLGAPTLARAGVTGARLRHRRI